MKKIPALCMVAFLVLARPVFAEAPTWQMIADESSITFHGKQMGSDFKGIFKSFSADIRFDATDLATSRVRASIDTASVDAGAQDRNKPLAGNDWFAPDLFPQAIFESTVFRANTDGSFVADGNLTIRDVTLPVSLPFTLALSKDDSGKEKALMTGKITIDRSKFNLGTGDWADTSIIPNDVPVDIVIVASKI